MGAEILQHLTNAHNAAKQEAINAISNDAEVEQRTLDTIKSLYALIQAVKQAYGL